MPASAATSHAPRPKGAWLLPALVACVPTAGLVAIWAATEVGERDLLLANVLYWLMPPVLAFVGSCAVLRWRAAAPLREHVALWWPGVLSAIALTVAVKPGGI